MTEIILVTSASGTVGSEVVKQLSKSTTDVNIKAAVHSAENVKRVKNDKVEAVQIDYNKPETLKEALNNVDKLFLLTLPAPNISDISSSAVKEAKKNDVKYIVKLSVWGADLEPGYTLGRFHRQEEKIIEKSGTLYTFLRPTSFMQNFVNFFGQTIKTQNAFYLPAGDGKVSFVDVRDIAAVAVEVLTKNNGSQQHGNKAYVITGQEALSYSQAAGILSKEIGRKISYIDVPEEDARKEMGMEDWLIDGFNLIRAGYVSQTTTVIEQIIGRKPISFEQFVRDYASSFK